MGWESDIQYFSRNFRETYSIDVHRAAMRGDQRPLLVEAYVIDIDCADLGFTLVLGVLSDYLTPEIYIHARTTEAQVNAILDQEELAGSLSRTYALIIQPEDVNQVGFRTTAYEGLVSIYYDDAFLISGECLAVMPWPDPV